MPKITVNKYYKKLYEIENYNKRRYKEGNRNILENFQN